MSFVFGLLLVIVSLAGALMVTLLVWKLWTEQPETTWEYMIAVLIGVGLLVWPVARQASLHSYEQRIDQYRQILELEELGQYRLINEQTGEMLAIFVDEDGKVRLSRTESQPQDEEPKATEEPPPSRPPEEEEKAAETAGIEPE